jgi:hypothetical protein
MTAQISDVVEFDGVSYSLAAIDGVGLFDPADHGLQVTMTSTANYRGYRACYAVRDARLLLAALHDVGLVVAVEETPPEALPRLAGKTPRWDGYAFAYDDLDLAVPFSGGLLIADGFIDELYVHMGFHPAWKYRRVHELVIDGGRVIRTLDRSEEIAAVRETMAGRDRPDPDDRDRLKSWIARTFERDYARSFGR